MTQARREATKATSSTTKDRQQPAPSPTPPQPPESARPPTTQRAEAIVERLGQNVGRFISNIRVRQPSQSDPSGMAAAGGTPPSTNQPAVERAEHLIDQAGYTMGRWAAQTIARAREEAEDIWADAQHARRRGPR
jgi:hypothetical protein